MTVPHAVSTTAWQAQLIETITRQSYNTIEHSNKLLRNVETEREEIQAIHFNSLIFEPKEQADAQDIASMTICQLKSRQEEA